MRPLLSLPLSLILVLPLLSLSACGSTPSKKTDSSAAKLSPDLQLSSPQATSFAGVRQASFNSDDGGEASSRRSVSAVASGDYAGRADVDRFVARMASKGLDQSKVVRALERARHDPWIIEYMDKQWRPASGPTGAWTRYRSRHITPAMLDKGSTFWSRHSRALDQASSKYGVPPEYIVAIIGIETRWGGYMGTHRIIDALATLAFDYPRRADYFQDELAHYLLMAEDQGFDPLQPVGSFAGAMGLGQFMPSSWHDYAVDFDGDGRRDLWDPEDAIGSVARYFNAHGWQTGAAVVARASGGAGLPWSTDTGFKTNYSVASLKAKGIQPTVALSDQRQVSLLRLDAAGGLEYWVGFENFYVITRYNNSTYYAMTVHQLAQALRARRDLKQPTLRMTDQPELGASAAPAG